MIGQISTCDGFANPEWCRIYFTRSYPKYDLLFVLKPNEASSPHSGAGGGMYSYMREHNPDFEDDGAKNPEPFTLVAFTKGHPRSTEGKKLNVKIE